MMPKFKHGRRGQRGHAVIEVTFLAPWIFFLFMGTIDFGFYSYAIIATENAARVAAMQTSKNPTTAADQTLACNFALSELNVLPNTRTLTTCGALPVIVNATTFVDADGATASRVDVTYQTILMIPIPGLTGRLSITRNSQMRLKQQP